MVDDARRTDVRERTGWGEPIRRRASEPRPGESVEVHEFIEVEEPKVRQPIEVHEHIAVAEQPPPTRTQRAAGLAEEQLVENWNRTQLYHDFLVTRRRRRFTAASLLLFGLAVLSTLWVLSALANTGVVLPSVALDAAQSLSVVSIAVLVVGTLLAFGAARGNLAALALGWVAGAVMMVVPMMLTPGNVSLGIQALAFLVVIAGLAVLLSCTLGLASWRGERVQRRFLGGPPPVRGVL